MNTDRSVDDFWGKENCSEVLVLSRPDIIRDIHADFFRVGCDIVETNTFGGSSIVLGEFDLADRMHEINLKAARWRGKWLKNSPPKKASVRCGIAGTDDEAAFAWPHWLRGDGPSPRLRHGSE